ncbi:GPI mannosyltransferase 2 [Geranomyces variabilis]|nr:GPI mannosyltransferase 2 [Geranomyces variabilis]
MPRSPSSTPHSPLAQKAVVYRAATTRLLFLLLAVCSHAFASDYDASTAAMLAAPTPTAKAENTHTVTLNSLLAPFVRWDAVYFLAIADRGYVHEQEFAFFPGLPLVMRAVAAWIPGLQRDQALMLAGVIVSNLSFVAAAVVLYRLGCVVLGDERQAYRAAILFAITPAGLFMSAIYTESLFALLSFSGMLCFSNGRSVLAALLWAGATLVRANGVLHAGFFIWAGAVAPFIAKKKISATSFVLGFMKAARLAVLVAAPFVAIQWYAYGLFCNAASSVPERPWCTSHLPSIYSFVQKEYWNNGYLTYYEARQIPNFLLAAPTFLISFAGLAHHMSRDPRGFFSLGSWPSPSLPRSRFATGQAPYIYLWLFLTVYSATMMHVQVVTRFFTSVPAFYWFAATAVGDGKPAAVGWRRAIVPYFLLYGLITAVLFANFLPPA